MLPWTLSVTGLAKNAPIQRKSQRIWIFPFFILGERMNVHIQTCLLVNSGKRWDQWKSALVTWSANDQLIAHMGFNLELERVVRYIEQKKRDSRMNWEHYEDSWQPSGPVQSESGPDPDRLRTGYRPVINYGIMFFVVSFADAPDDQIILPCVIIRPFRRNFLSKILFLEKGWKWWNNLNICDIND